MNRFTRIAMAAALVLTVITGASLDGLCAGQKKAVSGVLNITTGSAQEFMLFPGIGKAKAEAIIATRTAAPFTAVQDLEKVKGIGPKFIEKYSSNLTVTGPSTLQAAAPTVASTSPTAALPVSAAHSAGQ